MKHKHVGKGFRRRKVSKKKIRAKGTPTVNTMLQKFKPGDKIHVVLNSSVSIASPHRRFIGKTGKIIRAQGACYLVEIKDMRATKQIILHPAHIKKVGAATKTVKKVKKEKVKKTIKKLAAAKKLAGKKAKA